MAFMKAQMTEKQEWLCLDGNEGMEYIPADLLPMDAIRTLLDSDTAEDECAKEILSLVVDYASNHKVYGAEICKGYGVRSSADGYMDCTEWTFYVTKKEAERAYRREQRECEGKD